jgi:thiol-disulfide isomerase/thioredoxin
MEKKSFRIGLIIGVVISIIFYSFGFSKMHKKVALKEIAIDLIQIENLERKKISFKTGKPIVINFWATNCAPCVEEFPAFEKFKKKYGDRVVIMMVSSEKIEKILAFKSKHNYSLDIVHNLKSIDKYAIESLPATYFYNSKKEFVKNMDGGLNEEMLNKNIELLLEK